MAFFDSRSDDKMGRKAAAHQETQRRWRTWLNSEGALLLSIGLPEEILTDEDHWNDFCTHACLHIHRSVTGFTVDDISVADGRRLLGFLENLLTQEEKPYCGLYNALKERVAGPSNRS